MIHSRIYVGPYFNEVCSFVSGKSLHWPGLQRRALYSRSREWSLHWRGRSKLPSNVGRVIFHNKDHLIRYRDAHYNNRAVVRQFPVYNGNPYIGKVVSVFKQPPLPLDILCRKDLRALVWSYDFKFLIQIFTCMNWNLPGKRLVSFQTLSKDWWKKVLIAFCNRHHTVFQHAPSPIEWDTDSILI